MGSRVYGVQKQHFRQSCREPNGSTCTPYCFREWFVVRELFHPGGEATDQAGLDSRI